MEELKRLIDEYGLWKVRCADCLSVTYTVTYKDLENLKQAKQALLNYIE